MNRGPRHPQPEGVSAGFFCWVSKHTALLPPPVSSPGRALFTSYYLGFPADTISSPWDGKVLPSRGQVRWRPLLSFCVVHAGEDFVLARTGNTHLSRNVLLNKHRVFIQPSSQRQMGSLPTLDGPFLVFFTHQLAFCFC